MTNFEIIKDAETPKELAHILCNEIPECEYCPAAKDCDGRLNGFEVWLKKEAE